MVVTDGEVEAAVMGYIECLLERTFELKSKNKEHARGFCFCRPLAKLFFDIIGNGKAFLLLCKLI